MTTPAPNKGQKYPAEVLTPSEVDVDPGPVLAPGHPPASATAPC